MAVMSKKSLSAVKAKSEELKIPYENLLSAFVIEEAVTAVCESDEAENFQVKKQQHIIVRVLQAESTDTFRVCDLKRRRADRAECDTSHE